MDVLFKRIRNRNIPIDLQLYLFDHVILPVALLAKRLRAKFWADCVIPDTSMKFGTVVDHDQLSWIGYRTTLGDAYCACAEHFSD